MVELIIFSNIMGMSVSFEISRCNDSTTSGDICIDYPIFYKPVKDIIPSADQMVKIFQK